MTSESTQAKYVLLAPLPQRAVLESHSEDARIPMGTDCAQRSHVLPSRNALVPASPNVQMGLLFQRPRAEALDPHCFQLKNTEHLCFFVAVLLHNALHRQGYLHCAGDRGVVGACWGPHGAGLP